MIRRAAGCMQQRKNNIDTGPANCISVTIDDTAYATSGIACASGSLGGPVSTIYIDFDTAVPEVGDNVYNETPCSTPYSGGDFWYYTELTGGFGGNIAIQITTEGKITDVSECLG